ncbi:MAG: cupin domain-containing protein [Bacteroidetes bacterium]|mgnify:FL=1|nr:cupin domain-containing protein [Bacteroidota bacterium]
MQDDIILNSVGALSESEREKLISSLKNAGFSEAFLASDVNNLIERINDALINNPSRLKSPSAGLKDKIMARIKASPKKENTEDFDFKFADPTNDWFDHPLVNAIKVKVLSVNHDNGYAMLMMKVPAETEYPEHHHTSPEECLILEGDFQAEGRVLGPGDFHHAEPGSDHGKLYTRNGTTLLLVVNPADYGL